MELVYVAMLLHKAKKEINEANVKKVVEAAGIHKSDAEIKALVAALDGVNIDEAIKQAAIPVAAGPSSTAEHKKEEKKEEEKVDDSAAAAGLGALFG